MTNAFSQRTGYNLRFWLNVSILLALLCDNSNKWTPSYSFRPVPFRRIMSVYTLLKYSSTKPPHPFTPAHQQLTATGKTPQ